MTETLQARMPVLFNFLSDTGSKLERLNTKVFFAMIFIYHVLVVLQGIDFNDEGFHLTMYQQIFNDPESVQYGFWMWFCAIVGGIIMKVFAFSGALGIRTAGAVVNTLTIVLAYQLIRKYVSIRYLRVAIIVLVLFIHEDAKNLYYNNLSALLYFLAASFLFRGLRDRKDIFLLLAGFVVGVNIFCRIPNVLGVGLGLAILYNGYISGRQAAYYFKKAALFAAGVVAAVLAIVLVMRALGHFDIYIASLKMIFSINNASKADDGLEGSYGTVTLLLRNVRDWSQSFRWILTVALLVLFLGFINNSQRLSAGWLKTSVLLLDYLIVLGVVVAIFLGMFDSDRLLAFFAGISLVPGLLLFDSKRPKEFRLLILVGLLIMVIHPFGSGQGITTVAIYSFWIMFPVSIDLIAQLKSFRIQVMQNFGQKDSSLVSDFSVAFLRKARLIILGLIILACVYNVLRYPYLCDRHSRTEMFYSVDNKYMRGIFTSKGRAKVVNDLLSASSKYIKPNDIVLAYDCLPLYHFMTETRPYVRNPCIWFYSSTLFNQELENAQVVNPVLPVVIKQNIKTTGDGSAWPERLPAEKYENLPRNQEKNKIFNAFLLKYKYHEVWTNGAFSIYVPENK